jgi:hypothetical protein
MTNLEKAEELKRKGEFSMRTCWECNPAHKHLKKCGGLFVCFDCGRWWMNGEYFTNEKHCKKEFVERKPLGVTCITITRKKK